MRIWQHEVDMRLLQEHGKGTLVEHLGIEYLEIGDDYVKARMPVDHRTKQPMGLLHGGAHVALAESLGSMAANLCLDITKEYALGLDINSNHIRSVTSGRVIGIARPVHLGAKTQVWEIRIFDENDKLLNISRLTMMVLQHRSK